MTSPTIPLLLDTYNSPKHLVTLGRDVPKRMTAASHKTRTSRIIDRAERSIRVSGSRFVMVHSLVGRNDYGDMDFVLHHDYAPQGWQEKFAAGLGGSSNFWGLIQGTNTSVFNDDGYQVNIHVAPQYTYPSTMAEYLRFGGLGGLLRIMYENLGLKMQNYQPVLQWDHSGSQPILLEDSALATNQILGYQAEQFTYDTYTKNDLFMQIRACRYFNRQLFLDYEANPENAVALARNHLLKDFLIHLRQDTNTNRESVFVPESDAGKIWAINLKKRYASQFHLFLEEKNNFDLAQLHLTKLNTDIVKEVTGVTDYGVAVSIIDAISKKFKKEEDYRMYLTTSMVPTIRQEILTVYESMKPALNPPEASALADAVQNVSVEPAEKKISNRKPKAKKPVTGTAKSVKAKKPLPRTVTVTPVAELDTSFITAA